MLSFGKCAPAKMGLFNKTLYIVDLFKSPLYFDQVDLFHFSEAVVATEQGTGTPLPLCLVELQRDPQQGDRIGPKSVS